LEAQTVDLESFFQRHLWTGVGLLLGPAIAIGSLILHAYALIELGLPVEIWVAIGLAIFFLSVIGILYNQHQYLVVERPFQSPSSISTQAIGKTKDVTRLEVSNTLKDLTNHELRLTAYNIAARVGSFADNHIHESTKIRTQNISTDEKASRTAALDQAFNREMAYAQ
jgi:hypothetical protein